MCTALLPPGVNPTAVKIIHQCTVGYRVMRKQPIARILIIFTAGSEKPESNISQDNSDTLFLRNQSHVVFYLAGQGAEVGRWLGFLFFSCGAAAQRGPWPPHSCGYWITQNDASQSVGLLWTSDQFVAETSTSQHTTHNTQNRQTSMLPVGFESTISERERPYTYAFDRAATGTSGG